MGFFLIFFLLFHFILLIDSCLFFLFFACSQQCFMLYSQFLESMLETKKKKETYSAGQ